MTNHNPFQTSPREDAEAYLRRGNAYIERSEYDQAITEYSQAIALQPDLAEAY